jgi:hypothetical protein
MMLILVLAGVALAIYLYAAFAFHHNFKHYPM